MHVASGDLWAGAEVQLFHLATALNNDEDVSLVVILLNHGQLERQLIEKGVSVRVFDESTYSTLNIFHKIKSVANELQVDVIHSHREKENVLVSVIAKIIGCHSVRTVHGDSEFGASLFDFRQHLIYLINKFCGSYLQDKIISVSGELTDKLSRTFGADKLVTINNSVNVDYINKRSQEPIDTTIVTESRINIGFVGRFVPVKRVSFYYEVAKRVITLLPKADIHFYMIGDGPLFNEINSKVECEQLSHRIHLLGFVENSAPYIKQLSYLMFTSEHEGLPMTLLEAMALETPVISTNLPSLKNVLNGNHGGYFHDSENPDEFADFVANLIQYYDKSIVKAKLAKSILNNEYALAANINKYVELYKNILS